MPYTKHHNVLCGIPQIYNRFFFKEAKWACIKRNLNEAENVTCTEYTLPSTEFSVGACGQ